MTSVPVGLRPTRIASPTRMCCSSEVSGPACTLMLRNSRWSSWLALAMLRKLEVAGEFQDIAVDPAGYGSHHIGVTGKGTNTFIFSFSVTRTGQAFASSAVAR